MVLPTSWEKRIDLISYTDATPYHQNTIKEMVRAMMRLLHNKGILSNAQLKTFFDDIVPKGDWPEEPEAKSQSPESKHKRKYKT